MDRREEEGGSSIQGETHEEMDRYDFQRHKNAF